MLAGGFFKHFIAGYNILKYSIIEISFSEKKCECLGMIVYRVYKICETPDMIVEGRRV
jgi:hypothetical protein